MDIFSHGLWGAAAAKLANKKSRLKLNPWKAAWWGVFPDLFAFTPLFIWFFVKRILNEPIAMPHPKDADLVSGNTPFIYDLAHYLYQYSHSIIVFTLVVAVITFLKYLWKKERQWVALVPWTMGAWLLHILSDIPTHSYKFYPTPFLWPISEFKFDGFSWGQWWFILANYTALAIAYVVIWRLKSKVVLNKQKI